MTTITETATLRSAFSENRMGTYNHNLRRYSRRHHRRLYRHRHYQHHRRQLRPCQRHHDRRRRNVARRLHPVISRICAGFKGFRHHQSRRRILHPETDISDLFDNRCDISAYYDFSARLATCLQRICSHTSGRYTQMGHGRTHIRSLISRNCRFLDYRPVRHKKQDF